MGFTVSWVFATGAEWIPFDMPTQDLLESCWERGVDYSYVIDSHFGGANVFVHLCDSYVAQGPVRFAICRTTCNLGLCQSWPVLYSYNYALNREVEVESEVFRPVWI
ncbi:hypothetical protein BC938DRAFT_471751, partial [Jimgerdemannia flammicorona]